MNNEFRIIGAFKKTPYFQHGDELNAHMSSSFRGNRVLKYAEDVMNYGSGKQVKNSSSNILHPTTYNFKGFTLVELLVVMSIIAILAALSIFALSGAREAARDTRRKSDLQSVAAALELYKADCNFYPSSVPSPGTVFTGTACSMGANIYMQAIPDDPQSSQDYVYQGVNCVGANCRQFRYWTLLEDAPGSPPAGCSSAPSCGSYTCNFCVTNP